MIHIRKHTKINTKVGRKSPTVEQRAKERDGKRISNNQPNIQEQFKNKIHSCRCNGMKNIQKIEHCSGKCQVAWCLDWLILSSFWILSSFLFLEVFGEHKKYFSVLTFRP